MQNPDNRSSQRDISMAKPNKTIRSLAACLNQLINHNIEKDKGQ